MTNPPSWDERFEPVVSSAVQVILLALLLAFGVGLAVAGSVFGVGVPLAADSDAGAVAIDESTVTVSGDDSQVVTVEDGEPITAAEIHEEGGIVTVETERRGSFTEQERERVIDIATANETVASILETYDAYEFEVEPVDNNTSDTMSADANVSGEFSVNFTSEDSAATANDTSVQVGEEIEFSVERVEIDDSETIQIDRHHSSDEQALVTVQKPETGDKLLSVRVDTVEKAVVSITER